MAYEWGYIGLQHGLIGVILLMDEILHVFSAATHPFQALNLNIDVKH